MRSSVVVRAHAANVLSASRFALGAMWLAAFVRGDRDAQVLGSIALCAALTDFADGPVARQVCAADAFGGWLDSVADAAFVLTALTCEAQAGAIPAYVPALIAISFAQYVIDSILISGSVAPVKSRLGHWGGVMNFALVLLLAFASNSRSLVILIREASPLLAIFYLAAIFERMLGYVTANRRAMSRRVQSIHGWRAEDRIIRSARCRT